VVAFGCKHPIIFIFGYNNQYVSEKISQGVDFSTGAVSQIIGIFALAGIGIGATGGVAVNQIGGGAILGSIIILVVLTVTFLLGPVIGLIAGLRVGDEQGRSSESYLTGLLGSVVGYFVMIFAVVIIVSVLMAISSGGGGGGATQASTTSGASSSGLAIGEYIVPIIAVAIPTGITGLGGVYFGGNKSTAGQKEISLSKKYVATAIVVIGIVVAGAVVVPNALSSGPPLEVDGSTEFIQNTITADATITNPADSEKTKTVAVELVIDGSIIETRSEEITVSANDETTIRWSLVEGSELSQSQIDAVNRGNMELRFKIDDTTVDTDSPAAS
jgi:hypothetical protein